MKHEVKEAMTEFLTDLLTSVEKNVRKFKAIHKANPEANIVGQISYSENQASTIRWQLALVKQIKTKTDS